MIERSRTTQIITGFFWIWLALMMLTALFWFASCALKYARADDRFNPEDLEYLGAFEVQKGTGLKRFGYGMSSIAYNPALGTLFATGHPHGDFVGEITIPKPSKSPPYRRALFVQPFGDMAGSLRSQLDQKRLDSVGGLEVIDGRVYWSFFTYYSVQPFAAIDHATFGRSSTDLSDPKAEGLWKIGPYGNAIFSQKRTSRYMTEIPDRWAREHLPGRRIAVGKGDGAGNAGNSLGPPLFAVAIPAPGAEVLEAIPLIHYPPGDGKFFPGWSPCDRWTGVVWIDDGERGSVIFAGRRGLGEADYGSPQEVSERKNRATCSTAKGYHCDPYAAELVFFDPIDLARSARGEIEPYEVMPYATKRLEIPGHSCMKMLGGIAFNEDQSELYVVQDNKENPIVHVWRVGQKPGKEVPLITLMDVKLESFSSLATALLLEGASPEDLVAAIEMAKLKAEEWRENEDFESLSVEGE